MYTPLMIWAISPLKILLVAILIFGPMALAAVVRWLAGRQKRIAKELFKQYKQNGKIQ